MMAGIRLDAIPRIPGTNTRSRYPEISMGCTAVDVVIGGGLPLSSLCIIDENKSRAYATVLSKYFSAEGICCEHSLFIASTSRNPLELLEDLPDRINIASNDVLNDGVERPEDSTMKIAWRYSTAPKVDSSLSCSRRGIPQYDLMKKMDCKKMEACSISFFPDSVKSQDELPSYNDLYKRIQQKLTDDEYSITLLKPKRRVLRVVIEGIGSPFWQDPENDLKFVAHLRTLLCSYCAVAMLITNSSGMLNERKERLYAYGDLVVHLDAVECDNTMENFGDRFDGYFRLLKLPNMASIATYCPASSDLVFQLQKRKFDIRILHLPPALDDDKMKSFGPNCQEIRNFFDIQMTKCWWLAVCICGNNNVVTCDFHPC
ncbi:paxneb protein [Loa loa]|uniref:Elongator complex protein 4 n=2 Tax=Loa loa TaxID=7209 RepID=A0A1S0TIR5_LOALO|nr:paxneb protein [Loa loa]EFO14616.1 paxneb protein [Loa loa]